MHHRLATLAVAALGLVVAGQAMATPKPRVNEICLADYHKFCPEQALGRGVVIRCARAHLEQVTPDCKTAVEAANAVNEARREAKAARRASGQTASARSARTPKSAPAAADDAS